MQKHLNEAVLNRLFFSENNILKNYEDNHIEYKLSFGFGSLARYMKTMASFANKEGGYIIFGVEDATRKMVGLDANSFKSFHTLDRKQLTEQFRKHFCPEIIWEHETYKLNDLSFGIIYTYPSEKKPVVCIETGKDLRKHAIYYRYNAENHEIEYTELNTIIEIEKQKVTQQVTQQWHNIISKLIKTKDITQVALLDFENKILTGASSNLYIDENLIEKISFIKEGSFVDNGGQPALRLIGDIDTINGTVQLHNNIIEQKAINYNEIIIHFINQEDVNNPMEYVKQLCYQNSSLYPVFYYFYLAEKSIEEGINFINQIDVQNKAKSSLLIRINTLNSKFKEMSSNIRSKTSVYKAYIMKIESGELIMPSEINELIDLLEAICRMDKLEIKNNQTYLLSIMNEIYHNYYNNRDYKKIISFYRASLCWIDEAIYRDELGAH